MPGVGGHHDHERQGRDYQEDIGDQRHHVVARATKVGRRDAHEQREHGGHQASDERDDERLPGSPDQLREDVLGIAGGAQQVLPRRAQRLFEDLGVRVVGGKNAGNERDHDEEADDDGAGQRLAVAEEGATHDVQRASLRSGRLGRCGRLVSDEANIQTHRVTSAALPSPRIEPGGQEVGGHHRHQHCDRDQEE